MQFKTFLQHQKEEIEKYKWIESQKAGHDLGEDAVRQWVEKFAANYRKEYEDVYKNMVKETATHCKEKLKKKMPTVSEEIWDYFFSEVINTFTELWVKESICGSDKNKKKHIEEI